ncbi:hypothetical protein RRG08_001375, partial [Elysia crispata]
LNTREGRSDRRRDCSTAGPAYSLQQSTARCHPSSHPAFVLPRAMGGDVNSSGSFIHKETLVTVTAEQEMANSEQRLSSSALYAASSSSYFIEQRASE